MAIDAAIKLPRSEYVRATGLIRETDDALLLIGEEGELQGCLREVERSLRPLRPLEVNDRKIILGVIEGIYQQRAKQKQDHEEKPNT